MPGEGILLGAITTGLNRHWAKKDYKQQRQDSLADYQMQRTDALEDWQRNNEYNSPEAQMRRFKEAGLNPNLIYGQTNEASPVRSSNMDAPNMAPTHVEPMNIGEDVNSVYNVMRSKNENDILRQQKQSNDIKNAKGALDLIYYARGLKAVTEGKETATEVAKETKDANITKGIMEGDASRAKRDSAFSKAMQDNIMGEGGVFENLQNASINLVKANTQNALANANSTNSLLPYKINDTNESAFVKHVSGLYIKANTTKNEAEKSKILKEIEVLEERRQLLMKENGWYDFNQLLKGVNSATGVYKAGKKPTYRIKGR